jgi:hypothetical protein
MEDIPLIHGLRFDLSSLRERNDIAKRLQHQTPHIEEIDWNVMVDQICAGTIELFRQSKKGALSFAT